MALSFTNLLEQECKSLVRSSGMGRQREELAQHLRSFPVGNYIIFYRPVSEGIEIIHILHSARDVYAVFPSN